MTCWATFDCYGTLVDWNGGIRSALARLWPGADGETLLCRYHEIEPQVEAESPASPYRDVMAESLRRLAADAGLALPGAEAGALGDSLPSWPVFPEVPGTLEELRARGWRLAILSNTDPDLLAASVERIGVAFDELVVASEIGSYKPAPGHWETFFTRSGADRGQHVHVGASLFHDVRPARALGLATVWINRLGEPSDPAADRELPDLAGLPATLEELVS